jgi:hypothetical protein
VLPIAKSDTCHEHHAESQTQKFRKGFLWLNEREIDLFAVPQPSPGHCLPQYGHMHQDDITGSGSVISHPDQILI